MSEAFCNLNIIGNISLTLRKKEENKNERNFSMTTNHFSTVNINFNDIKVCSTTNGYNRTYTKYSKYACIEFNKFLRMCVIR